MKIVSALRPKIFISYSRRDMSFAYALVRELRDRGFQVFQDASDIDLGDNFVATLVKEINSATAIIAIVSRDYSLSRWAQAELYHGIASNKQVIPLLISNTLISDLDEPLARLLRDTQYLAIDIKLDVTDVLQKLGDLLTKARVQHRHNLLTRLAPILLLASIVIIGSLWVINHFDELDNAKKRESAVKQISSADKVLQHEKIAAISTLVTGDLKATGEIVLMSQNPALSDVARFNALALGSELRKGQKERRWYIRNVHLNRTKLEDITLTNFSMLGGGWTDTEVVDSTFSGGFWPKSEGFTMSGVKFNNVQFFGGEMENITLVDTLFENSKFRGVNIDTTNFSKVLFITKLPIVTGNPVITPNYTLFERSVLISKRSPPENGVIDLTETGDDVVFDGVVFVDSRLEGWFKPEWFKNSTFERCSLPDSLRKDSLVEAGNIVN